MAITNGPFSVDMCESVQGYPPRLTEAGAGQELLSIFAPDSINWIWVGLTTTVDEYVLNFSFIPIGFSSIQKLGPSIHSFAKLERERSLRFCRPVISGATYGAILGTIS